MATCSGKEVDKFIEWRSVSDNVHSVWRYFLREVNGQSAKCKLCNKVLKTGGGSTKGPHVHLNAIHKIYLLKQSVNKEESINPDQQRKKTKSIDADDCVRIQEKVPDFFIPAVDNTLAAILARMTARDGLPFSIFCTSIDLREAIRARGFEDIPKSPNSIKELVLGYSRRIREFLRSEIKKEKELSRKFCLTFYEWASPHNRRYVNINLHFSGSGSKFWNLGLIRVYENMPAEVCLDLLKSKLNNYGVSLEKDIFAITTNEAGVMLEVGKLIPACQQLCIAHGIKLAVFDVLYKSNDMTSGVKQEDFERHEMDFLITGEDESSDEEISFSEESEEYILLEDNGYIKDISNMHIKPLIQKIRSTVKLFRKSPAGNERLLQKYVFEKYGEEKHLILDTKLHWNSLVEMLERFLILKTCIIKSLADLNSGISFTEYEFDLASSVFATLQPIKIAVEALCHRDANLLICDTALKFMMEKIKNVNTEFSHDMENALQYHLKQRRTELSGVLQYLHNGLQAYETNWKDLFSDPSESNVTFYIIECLSRLYQQSDGEMVRIEPNDATSITPYNDVIVFPGTSSEIHHSSERLKEELNFAIKRSLTPAVPKHLFSYSNTTELIRTIKNEINHFDNGGSRGGKLQCLYDYLITIPPTCVDVEKIYSPTDCAKFTSKMSDDTLDALCFLRAYFKNL